MKRLVQAVGVLGMLGLLFLGGRSWSTTKPSSSPGCRIALIDMTYVRSNSQKYKAMQEKIQQALEPYRERVKVVLVDRPADGCRLSEEERLEYERKLEKILQEVEAISLEAKTFYSGKSRQVKLALYTGIQQAAERYAKTHGIDLVLRYNDHVDEELPSRYSSIRPPRPWGPFVAYAASGLDISKEMVAAFDEK
jgi:Skp family chaperone for outer membrane proteins